MSKYFIFYSLVAQYFLVSNYLFTLKGFKIDVIQDNGSQVECYKQSDNVTQSSTNFTNVIWGNGINISSTSGPQHFFVFCEVEVYGLCFNRTYGEQCEKFCYCKDNVQCNYLTGECPTEECLPGFTGSSCNQLCDEGFYGVNCSKKCSDRYCINNNSICDNENGNCNGGCQKDYSGVDCIRLSSPSAPLDDPGGENDSTMIIVVVLGSIVIILLVVMIVGFVYFRKRISSKPPDIKDPPVEYDVITSSTNAVNAQVSESTPTTTPNTDSQQHREKPDNTISNEPTLPDHAYVNEIADNELPKQSRSTNYDTLGTVYMNENLYEHISN